jgi:predicted acyl esterase
VKKNAGFLASGFLGFFFLAWVGFAGEVKPAANLSQPQYKVKCEFNVAIPMRDGVKLSADVYRPDAEGRFPVLLTRTYYGKSTQDIFHQLVRLLAQGH